MTSSTASNYFYITHLMQNVVNHYILNVNVMQECDCSSKLYFLNSISLNSTQVTPVSPYNQLRFPRNILPEVMLTTSYFPQSLQFNSLDRCPMAFSFLHHLWLSTTVIKWPCSTLIQDAVFMANPTTNTAVVQSTTINHHGEPQLDGNH